MEERYEKSIERHVRERGYVQVGQIRIYGYQAEYIDRIRKETGHRRGEVIRAMLHDAMQAPGCTKIPPEVREFIDRTAGKTGTDKGEIIVAILRAGMEKVKEGLRYQRVD